MVDVALGQYTQCNHAGRFALRGATAQIKLLCEIASPAERLLHWAPRPSCVASTKIQSSFYTWGVKSGYAVGKAVAFGVDDVSARSGSGRRAFQRGARRHCRCAEAHHGRRPEARDAIAAGNVSTSLHFSRLVVSLRRAETREAATRVTEGGT